MSRGPSIAPCPPLTCHKKKISKVSAQVHLLYSAPIRLLYSALEHLLYSALVRLLYSALVHLLYSVQCVLRHGLSADFLWTFGYVYSTVCA
jgi:hypothetical protein